MLFVFLLGFFLLLVCLLARFHCVVYVGVGLSWLGCFFVRASCWPGSSRLDCPCVFFNISASAGAFLCARRLACRLFVRFCSWKVVAIFGGFCVGGLCVVVCWMFEGCRWLVCEGGWLVVQFSE